jgi:hypothetical protein
MEKEETVSINIPYESGFTHILFNLAGQGYSCIRVEYSGGGDEGHIQDINVMKRKGTDPNEKFYNQAGQDGPPLDEKLSDIIRDRAYKHILDNADDWCNNEGGGGTLYISTDDGEYHADHYINIISTEESSLDGQLFD